MVWCEDNAIDYVFGLPGNTVLQRLVDEAADDIRTRRALEQKPVLRGYAETIQAEIPEDGTSRLRPLKATSMGLDVRFVVTNLDKGSAAHVYDVIYKTQRTSCRSPIANQVRLVLHTAADARPTRGGVRSPSSQQRRVRHTAAQAP
ncbi:hypothetical protein MesoLj113b_63810 [Mesorhizobium sp. 113-3-3]|nr:hypothetical protein MesoLj113b_63810 [Mesorhizobium sp. 113-3-3]BCG90715.1 hypothetical protein MesoLj113c_68250 [Mesorhizobium sp. 113-3-9]